MTATNKDGSPRGYWIKVARANGISENTYYARIQKLGKLPEDAATEPLREMRKLLEHGDRELIEGLHDAGVAPKDIADKLEVESKAVHAVLCRMRKRRREEGYE